MTLGYSQYFPDGTPTCFKEKILLSLGLILRKQAFPVDAEKALEIYRETGCMFIDGNDNDLLPVEGVKIDYRPKLHSIRKDVHERWRPELDIHHVYGNRTKQRDCFLVNKCVSVQRISIFSTAVVDEENEVSSGNAKQIVVMVDGRVLSWEKSLQLAYNDGFDSLGDFFNWFNQDFSGRIIHWTKLRY